MKKLIIAGGFILAVGLLLFSFWPARTPALLSPHTTVYKEFRTPHHTVRVTLTPVEEVTFLQNLSTDFQNAVTSLGPKNAKQWVSVYVDGIQEVFSPLGCDTDFFPHAFVHPAMVLSASRKSILVLGGGDGVVVKEVQKYADTDRVLTVNEDAEWLNFTKTDSLMRTHTHDAFHNRKVQLVISEPWEWVRATKERFDVVLVDLPAVSIRNRHLQDLKRVVSDQGTLAFQTGDFDSAFFWSLTNLMSEAGFQVIPHHTLDPTGYEGLILLTKEPADLNEYESKLAHFPFINPTYLISGEGLDYFASNDVLGTRSELHSSHAFLPSSWLHYYRSLATER